MDTVPLPPPPPPPPPGLETTELAGDLIGDIGDELLGGAQRKTDPVYFLLSGFCTSLEYLNTITFQTGSRKAGLTLRCRVKERASSLSSGKKTHTHTKKKDYAQSCFSLNTYSIQTLNIQHLIKASDLTGALP